MPGPLLTSAMALPPSPMLEPMVRWLFAVTTNSSGRRRQAATGDRIVAGAAGEDSAGGDLQIVPGQVQRLTDGSLLFCILSDARVVVVARAVVPPVASLT